MTVEINQENAYIPFNITWEDLTEDAQNRLLDALNIKYPEQAAFHTHVVHTLNVGWINDGLLERVMILDINKWYISKDNFEYYPEDERGPEYWGFSDDVSFPFGLQSNNEVLKLLEEHEVTDNLEFNSDPEHSCFYIYIYEGPDVDTFIERYNALVKKLWKYSDCNKEV